VIHFTPLWDTAGGVTQEKAEDIIVLEHRHRITEIMLFSSKRIGKIRHRDEAAILSPDDY